MIQDLINAFDGSKGAKFVAFEYTNRFNETAGRLIQINTNYENAVKKDLDIIANVEYVENDQYDLNTFRLAQSELIKSAKKTLGDTEGLSKDEIEKHENRSKGQTDAYVKIAKNIKYNVEKQQIYIFAKEVRKNVITEGVYPHVNKQSKTIAKDFIKKSMKSSKYRNFVVTNINGIKVNGDTIELT